MPTTTTNEVAMMPTSPYEQGQAAFIAGEPADSNPYPAGTGDNGQRTWFFHGFYDARIGKRLGPIFQTYGIEWP